jgi:hypothetical protein
MSVYPTKPQMEWVNGYFKKITLWGGHRPRNQVSIFICSAGIELTDWTNGLVQYEKDDANPDRLKLRPEKWGVSCRNILKYP